MAVVATCSTTRHLARRTPTGFLTLCMRRVSGTLPLPSYAPLCRLCDEQERKARPKIVPLR